MRRAGWYLRRLARMSPPEILHRLGEQARKAVDRRRRTDWARFGRYDGPLHGLPGMDRILSVLPACGPGFDLARGRFCFLNQDWPATAPDWRKSIWFLDPVTGTYWPGAESFAFDIPYRDAAGKGDVKFVWELNRLQFLQRAARDAGGDPARWGEIYDLLKAWMDANPPFRGINWNSGIEAASRLVSILVVYELADDAQRQRLEPLVRPFIAAHAWWLHRYPSLFSSANNHRVSELTCIFLAALCAPGRPEAAAQMAEAQQGLEREMLNQFHGDGVGAEQSPTYASYSLEWFTLAGMAAEAMGRDFSPAYKARAAAALEHLAWMMDDGGHPPRIGDDDEGRVLGFHPESYVHSVCALAAAWLGVALARPMGIKIFEAGGYTVIRQATPQGTLLAVMDHGPLGFLSIAAHGHADALSLWLHWGDEAILVDAGTYLYHAGQGERDRFRGTPAHNTLAIDGRDQSSIAGPFNWSRHAHTAIVEKTPESVTAECGGYVKLGILHRRRFSRAGDGSLIVADSLMGPGLKEGHSWASGFLLAPGVAAVLEGAIARITTPKGRKLQLALLSGQSWQEQTAAYSAGFNLCAETTQLMVQGHTRLDETSPLLEVQIAHSH